MHKLNWSLIGFLVIGAWLAACAPPRTAIVSTPLPPPSSTPPAERLPTLAPPLPTPSLHPSQTPIPDFYFDITADMPGHTGPLNDTPDRYRGALEAMAQLGKSNFMISPGDIAPDADTRWTIDHVLGQDYIWLPVPGNHDLGQADMDWLRQYLSHLSLPFSLNPGPPECPLSTYSFDFQSAHFIALNEYCDATSETHMDGAVTGPVLEWLKNDLQKNSLPLVFVYGHEPAYPQPDKDLKISRHVGESLDKFPNWRDEFWKVLQTAKVTAYICGHTHAFSAVNINGIWQLDAGHSMGTAVQAFPSTFVRIHVQGSSASYATYRAVNNGLYVLTDEGRLTP